MTGRAIGQAISGTSKRYSGINRGDGSSGHVSRNLSPTTAAKNGANNAFNPDPNGSGVGSQSRGPVGVQGGGFGAFPGGAGGVAPQVGGGDYAKSTTPKSPSQTTGSAAKPYGASPLKKSSNDALTKALLEKILNDRKLGEQAVKRNPETKKISEVDREKAKLDEKAKAEVAKLAETFDKGSKELKASIDEFRKNFEQQLKETDKKEKAEKVPEEKQLNNILDDLVKYSKNDKYDKDGKPIGNERGSNKYNPQNFMDAAERLDTWMKDNPEEAKKYGDDLKNINEKAQSLKGTAQEEIAYYENNPNAVLRTADISARNSASEAGRLKESIDSSKVELSTEEQANVDKFKDQLDKSMKSLNPEKGETFDIEASKENLDELKKSFNEIPDSIKNNPEIQRSFNEVTDFGENAIRGQKLARTMEPDSAEFKREASEYVSGSTKANTAQVWSENRTSDERKADLKEAIGDDDLIKEVQQREEKKDPEVKTPSTTTKDPSEAVKSATEVSFGDDTEVDAEKLDNNAFDAIDEVATNELENTAKATNESQSSTSTPETDARSLEEALDLDSDELEIEDIADDVSSEVEEDLEVEDFDLDLELEELDLELEIE